MHPQFLANKIVSLGGGPANAVGRPAVTADRAPALKALAETPRSSLIVTPDARISATTRLPERSP